MNCTHGVRVRGVASWRDRTRPQTQHDLDGLLNVALGFAQQQLARHGEFFPYAAAVTMDGQAELIAARPDQEDDRPLSNDVVDACFASLISQRNHIRAGAVVADIRLAKTGTDAIQVSLEHVDGPSITVILPYAKMGNTVDYGEARAQPGQSRIWTSAS